MATQYINDFLTEDHERLDELLENFRDRKRRALAEAREILRQFTVALHRHLQWEETILFPLFEQKTGQAGLTDTLRAEHEEIREWLAALNDKVEQGDLDSDREEKMLEEELGGHNGREEYALYPQLDKLLTDEERQRVFEAMSDDAASQVG